MRKSDRLEASRIQKLIMFMPRDSVGGGGGGGVSGNHVSSALLQYDERGQAILADGASVDDVSTSICDGASNDDVIKCSRWCIGR